MLAAEGFKVKYADEWNGTAERGSAAATFFAGAFAGKKAQHIKIGVAYRTSGEGQTLLVLTKLTTGAMAGAVGVSRAKKAYEQSVAGIRTALETSGQLVG